MTRCEEPCFPQHHSTANQFFLSVNTHPHPMNQNAPTGPRYTERQIQSELTYRIQERLGILCGANTPTEEQLSIATREAEIWESRFLLHRILNGQDEKLV